MFETQQRESPHFKASRKPLVGENIHNSGGSHPACSSSPPITQTGILAEGNSPHCRLGRRQKKNAAIRDNSIWSDAGNLAVIGGKLREGKK